LTPAQLDELLATAAALGDKDLQHKIYFLKGTNNLAEISQSEGAVTRHVLESLFEVISRFLCLVFFTWLGPLAFG